MTDKKDKQTTIIELKPDANPTKEEFLNILKSIAPGTPLRAAVDNIVEAKKGGLIVIENDLTHNIIDGGFRINSKFTPQKLLELAKMDGAIILSPDARRIMFSNVTLVPESKIKSEETGTRHKAAERTAKMTGTLTIAISERKNQINIYYKNLKYHIRRKSEILRKATETLQILEKQRELFDLYVERLNYHEIFNDLNLIQASKVIQKGKTMEKILSSQERTLIELGNEAVALKFRIRELMQGVSKEVDLTIKDYTNLNLKKSKILLDNLKYDELIDVENVLLSLAQNENNPLNTIPGWRILTKTCLKEQEINLMLKELNDLNTILESKDKDYKKIIGPEKSLVLNKELKRIKNQ